MTGGMWNRILWVDLSTRTSHVEELTDDDARAFVGGSGLGARILLEHTTPATDPLGPDNVIVFGLGPMQTGSVPGNAKWSVSALSPMTGTFADSAAGADWGIKLKRAGYDALAIKGCSPSPVVLDIEDDQVSFLSGSEAWGRDSYEAADLILERIGDRTAGIVTIGPAGEMMSYLSCIIADKHSFAGRCGLGAVMGSKHLKAIVARGSKEVEIHDGQLLRRLTTTAARGIAQTTRDTLRQHGTPELCIFADSIGDMPVKGWMGDHWPEGAKVLGAPNYTEYLNAKPLPCVHCPVGCHRDIRRDSQRYGLIEGPGPEYETLGMLGSNLLVDDLEAVAQANDLCNRLGIDTISAGACVGLAIEWFERGWLDRAAAGGLALKWGDGDVLVEAVRQLGVNQGLGRLFSRGSVQAAAEVHPEAADTVVHVKGLDFPAHDARACWSLAINYATSPRGACHMRGVSEDVEMGGWYTPEIGVEQPGAELFCADGKAFMTKRVQDYCSWVNSAVLCVFMLDGGGMTLTQALDIQNAITGWGWSADDLITAGERIFTAQRLINVRGGHGRVTDTFPSRMRIAAKEGGRAGKVPPFEQMLDEYYQVREWLSDGRPSPALLDRLELGRFAGAAAGS